MSYVPYILFMPERGGVRLSHLIVTVLCLAFWAGVVGAASSYGSGSPIPSATVPPSSYESGLIRSGNPVDNSGNLVVTGNIAGGRHFRDSVPYLGTTGFRAPLGSSSLDSFLRYSGDPDDFGGYTGSYRPFYSPSGTVATSQPGIAGVFAPAAPRITGRAPDIYAPGAVSGVQADTGQGLWSRRQMQYAGPVQYRPMSRTPQELEGIILNEFPADPHGETEDRFDPQSSDVRWQNPALSAEQDSISDATYSGTEQYREKMERFRRELAQIRQETAGLEQKLAAEGISPRDYLEQEQPETGTQVQSLTSRIGELSVVEPQLSRKRVSQFEHPVAGESEDESLGLPRQWTQGLSEDGRTSSTEGAGTIPAWELLDFERQTNRQLDGAESLQGSVAAEQDESDAVQNRTQLNLPSDAGKASLESRDLGLVTGGLNYEPRATDSEYSIGADWIPGSKLRSELVEESPIQRPTALEELKGLSHDEIATRARQIMGPHETLASFSQAKFEQYIRAGAEYLKMGKYYRAADAYKMALIYKPNDPLANAGRSHALFAAGEFMSSALFLSRALQVHPECALSKIDIVAVAGGKDKLDDRVLDIKEGIKVSDAPELQFLLAYVYYQMGALAPAKEQIDAAYKKLPDSPVVHALRRAIYSS